MDIVPISRSRSVTSLTETTVSSSCQSRLTKGSMAIENFIQDASGPTQNNVRIENSNGIRVGDVIYNIYSPAPPGSKLKIIKLNFEPRERLFQFPNCSKFHFVPNKI